MAIEFEKLIAYFGSDISALETGAKKATSIVDALEARINKFKGEIKLTANSLQAKSSVEALDKSFTTTKKAAENLKTTIEAIVPKPTISRYWENEAAEVKKSIAIIEKSVASTNRNNPGADSLKRIGAFKVGNASEPNTTVKAPSVSGVDVEFQRAQAIVKNYQRQTANGEKQLTQLVRQQAEAQYRARTKQIEQSAKEYLKELNKIKTAERSAQTKGTSGNQFGSDLFSTIFGATTASGLAVNAISNAISLTKNLASEIAGLGVSGVQVAATFNATTKAFELFTGSTRRAKDELALIDEAARNTPGLRLEAAEAGVTELRSLGFEAEVSRKLIVGLAGQKLINPNLSNDAIQRVIVNLTQLSAGSTRASADLKELKRAIPTLGPVLEQAFKTADPKKIGELFKNNPDEALKKFVDALEKAKTPAGGLNDAIDKLNDSFLEIGREFGQPILDPLTVSVKGLTELVRENQGEWHKLGQFIGDTISGANITFKELEKFRKESEEKSGFTFKIASFFGYESVEAFNKEFEKAFKPLSADRNLQKKIGITPLAEIGKNARTADAVRQVQSGLQLKAGIGQEFRDLTPDELLADQNAKLTRENRAKEVARQQDLVSLQFSSKQAEQILKSRYAIEQALLDSSVRYTSDQEKQYIAQSFALKARAIQADIAQQSGFFNKQIQLNEGNTVELEKLESEKSLTLGKLNNDLKLNSIARAKEIAAIERKSYEERRQAAIEFQNLRVQEVNFQVDNEISDLQRAIEQRNGASDGGYARLLEITNKGYGLVLQATRESLALQLEDQALTAEQRNNLIGKGYLEEAKLAEENRRNIVSIQDRQKQEIISRLTEQFQTIQSLYQAQGDLVGSIAAKFYDPASFSSGSNKGFQDIILGKHIARKADDAFQNYQALKASPESTEPQIKAALDAFTKLEAENSKFKASFQSLDPVIQGVYTVIGNLGNQLQTTAGTYENFDKIAKLSLFAKQRTDLEAFNAEIQLNQTLLRNAKTNYEDSLNEKINKGAIERDQLKRADPGVESLALREVERGIAKAKKELEDFKNTGVTTNNEILQLEANSKKLDIGFQNLQTTQAKGQIDQTAQSVKGLREEIEKLRAGDVSATNATLFGSEQANAAQTKATLNDIIALKSQIEKFKAGDKETILTAQEAAQRQVLQQQVGSYQQLIYLKEQLANYDKTEQLQIQIAAEQRLLEIRQASTQQAIAANQTIQDRVNLTLASLPTYGTQIKDFFGQLPESIGNIFDTAIQNWDGTFKGFFKSIGISFAQLLQDLTSQLLKAAFAKLLGQLFGSLLGGIGGAGAGLGDFGTGSSAGFAADGGLITGTGTAKSDSIPMMLSNGEFVQQAKAVDYYGVDFMKMVNELQLPHQIVNPLQFAAGGYITGVGTSKSDSIAARVSNGEFVQQAKAVDFYGVEFMNAVNNLKLPRQATNFSEIPKFATGGLVASGPDIFVPRFNGSNESTKLPTDDLRRNSKNGSSTTINNISIPQTFNAPRGTVAPKSAKQAQEHALAGVSRALKDNN